jgi:hypothetical protein
MISVPNRLRLLNGSKLLFLAILILSISSCGIFKDQRSSKPSRTYKKHKPVKKADTIKVDTLEFEEEVVDLPEIDEEDLYQKYGSELKDVYKVALILPLETGQGIQDLSALKSDLSYRFINYYAGIQLALEDLSKKGLNLEVEVMNSSLESNDGRRYMNQLNKLQPDLIIGPYERDLLKELAAYGKRKQIPVISPWQSSSKITRDNPYYIQLKPDIKAYYQKMVEDINQHFISGQVYIIGRENMQVEKNRINYIQEVQADSWDAYGKVEPYQVFYVEEDSLSQGQTAFDSLFVDQFYREIAVLIPNWSFRDEQFIYSCLRKLNAEKQETTVTVYGMPIVYDSDKIGYNLYNSLNVRLVMDGYVQTSDEAVSAFRNRYYNQFKALPLKDALEGYDMMMYIGSNLARYGTKFQFFLTDVQQDFLHTSFRMRPKLQDDKIEAEDLESVDYFENAHIDVWGFDYNSFRKSD